MHIHWSFSKVTAFYFFPKVLKFLSNYSVCFSCKLIDHKMNGVITLERKLNWFSYVGIVCVGIVSSSSYTMLKGNLVQIVVGNTPIASSSKTLHEHTSCNLHVHT